MTHGPRRKSSHGYGPAKPKRSTSRYPAIDPKAQEAMSSQLIDIFGEEDAPVLKPDGKKGPATTAVETGLSNFVAEITQGLSKPGEKEAPDVQAIYNKYKKDPTSVDADTRKVIEDAKARLKASIIPVQDSPNGFLKKFKDIAAAPVTPDTASKEVVPVVAEAPPVDVHPVPANGGANPLGADPIPTDRSKPDGLGADPVKADPQPRKWVPV